MIRTILDIILIVVGILIAQRLGVFTIAIGKRMKKMEEALARLQSTVSRQTGVIAGAITLLQGLAQTVRDAKDDPEQLNQLADRIDGQTDALAAALAENTVASGELPPADGGVEGTGTAAAASGEGALATGGEAEAAAEEAPAGQEQAEQQQDEEQQ